MSKVGGLGRGLDALLGGASITVGEVNGASQVVTADGVTDRLVLLDPHLLDPNPQQPRRAFDEESLAELRDSIKEHGVLQPIIAEEAAGGRYFIVAGERRTRAAIMAGLERVPVVVRHAGEVVSIHRPTGGTQPPADDSTGSGDGGVSADGGADRRRLEMALIENIQRTDLNPIEEATAYERLMSMGGLSQEALAQRVGKKRSTVANALRLLGLSGEIKDALQSGSISAGHARALLSVEDEGKRAALFKRVTDESLSVRQTEAAAKEISEVVSIHRPTGGTQPPTDNNGDGGNGGGGNNGNNNGENDGTAQGGGLLQGLAGGRNRNDGKGDGAKRDPDIVAIEDKMIGRQGTKCRINGTLEKGRIEIDYYSRADLDRLCALLTGEKDDYA